MSEHLGEARSDDSRLGRVMKTIGSGIWADVCERLGIKPEGYPPTVAEYLGNDNNYGFRVGFDPNYSPRPVAAEGAPIVDSARSLRARREGRVALSSGVSHPEAKALLEEIYAQRPKVEPHD